MEKFFKKDNKGFTLVELIVVIAVIAVITVIATPKLIEYVEKSRKGTDENAIWEVAHAAETAYVGTENKDDNVIKVFIRQEGNASYLETQTSGYTTNEEETLTARVDSIFDDASYVYKSKAFRNRTWEITVNKETGKATVDIPEGENQDYASQIAGPINNMINYINKYGKYVGIQVPTINSEELNVKIHEGIAKGETAVQVTKNYLVEAGVPERIVNMFF